MQNKSYYEFSPEELISLDLQNPSFRNVLDCGGYIYSNRLLCLNDRDCYTEKNGEYTLDYTFIEKHLHEYCLSPQVPRHLLTYFDRVSAMHPKSFTPAAKQSAKTVQETDWLYEQIRLTKQDIARKSAPGNQPPHVSFCELFQYHRKASGMTQELLSGESGVSVRTISRMEHNEIERHKLGHIIACIVAMHLKWDESTRLIELAGYNWRNYNNLDDTYKRILRFHYMSSVTAINDYLQRLGYLPLSPAEHIS